MSTSLPIAIFAGNAAQRDYLALIVRMAGHTPELDVTKFAASPVLIAAADGYPAAEGQDVLSWRNPLKAGELLQRLRNILDARHAVPAQIAIAGAVLDTVENTWAATASAAPVRLTDKEVEIILCLHNAGGIAVSREDLLRTVWSYVPEAETHTLETHIYRLRQKIEKDPAAPSVLLTDGEGYRLAF